MRFRILTLDLADLLAVGDVARFKRFAVHFVEGDGIADPRNGRGGVDGRFSWFIRLSHQTDPFGYHITLLNGQLGRVDWPNNSLPWVAFQQHRLFAANGVGRGRLLAIGGRGRFYRKEKRENR